MHGSAGPAKGGWLVGSGGVGHLKFMILAFLEFDILLRADLTFAKVFGVWR